VNLAHLELYALLLLDETSEQLKAGNPERLVAPLWRMEIYLNQNP
jgi:hypothetical protein